MEFVYLFCHNTHRKSFVSLCSALFLTQTRSSSCAVHWAFIVILVRKYSRGKTRDVPWVLFFQFFIRLSTGVSYLLPFHIKRDTQFRTTFVTMHNYRHPESMLYLKPMPMPMPVYPAPHKSWQKRSHYIACNLCLVHFISIFAEFDNSWHAKCLLRRLAAGSATVQL